MNTPPLVPIALALFLGSSSAADPLAAQDYPTQPIKVVVPAAAGGPSDFPALARSVR
jgi:tripartite-type tricarboxylate transporter receptor subunit TctC